MSATQLREPSTGGAKTAALVLTVTAVAVISSAIVGWAFGAVIGMQSAPWILGRSAGVTSYLLLVALVALGLLLSHPWRTKVTWPSTVARIRLHVSLAVFTLVFTVLHIVVLATDSYAGVGIAGALLPFGAEYRPIPVTFGVLGIYAGLLAGLTAAFASGVARRVWWPVHKVAIVALVLVWLHGVLAGSDSPALMTMYIVSGLAVLVLAVSRYTARSPADRAAAAAEAAEAAAREPVAAHRQRSAL